MNKLERLFGLDILRTICILIIVYYHSWETVFGNEKVFFASSQSTYGLLSEGLAVYLSLGGLGIVLLSFFLIGFKDKILTVARMTIIIGGLLAITPPDESGHFSFDNIEWSVYAFLLVSFLFVYLLNKVKHSHYVFGLLSLLLLLTRTSHWQVWLGELPENLSYVLYGEFANTYVGWPLLPWLGLPVMAWSLGKLAKQNATLLSEMKIIELIIWTSAIAGVFVWSDTIVDYPISRSPFYDHVFNMPLLNFWLRLLIFLFLMRISFVEVVRQKLASFSLIQFIGNLAWNRHFGFCYITEFVFLSLGIPLKDWFLANPRVFDFYWLYVLFATELTIRGMFYLLKLANKGK